MAKDENRDLSVNAGLNAYRKSTESELDQALFEHESLVSLAARFQPNSALPALVTGSQHRELSEETWYAGPREPFPDREIKRNIFKELAPYLGAAMLSAVFSGSVLFYFLGVYSAGGDGILANAPSLKQARTASAASIDQANFVSGEQEVGKRDSVLDPLEPPAPQSPLLANTIVSGPRAQPVTDRDRGISNGEPAEQTHPMDTIVASLPRTKDAAVETDGLQNQQPDGRAALSPPNSAPKSASPTLENRVLAKLAPDEEARMLKRAADLLKENDIASALLIYKYLAERGSTLAEDFYKRAEALEKGRAASDR